MKLIVQRGTNVIVFIGDVADIVDGNINTGATALANASNYLIKDVLNIPDGVKIQTHCYTDDKNFYPNPNYNSTPNEEVVALRAELAKKDTELVQLNRDMAEQTNAILDLFNIILGGI